MSSRNEMEGKVVMEKLKAFSGRTMDHGLVKELADLGPDGRDGIRVRYLPDPPDVFDEYEFGIRLPDGREAAFLVAVEKGAIGRILFGWPDPQDPDLMHPMKDEDLAIVMDQKGEAIAGFLRHVTGVERS